ncbi:MAG: hypothetical protein MJY89_01730 [Bacteroidales bacterium]|nr:hypothetical protein [Bacteroidales bacterium]
MSVFVIIVCAILFVFSILEAFVFGDKYARWWFRQFSKDYRDYDLKKFRFMRGVTLGILFIIAFLMGFLSFKYYEILLPAALVAILLHYYIILRHCKKPGEK